MAACGLLTGAQMGSVNKTPDSWRLTRSDGVRDFLALSPFGRLRKGVINTKSCQLERASDQPSKCGDWLRDHRFVAHVLGARSLVVLVILLSSQLVLLQCLLLRRRQEVLWVPVTNFGTVAQVFAVTTQDKRCFDGPIHPQNQNQGPEEGLEGIGEPSSCHSLDRHTATHI